MPVTPTTRVSKFTQRYGVSRRSAMAFADEHAERIATEAALSTPPELKLVPKPGLSEQKRQRKEIAALKSALTRAENALNGENDAFLKALCVSELEIARTRLAYVLEKCETERQAQSVKLW